MRGAGVDLIEPRDITSLSALFRERIRRTPRSIAYRFFDLRDKAWVQATWIEMEEQVRRWQSAMLSEGLKPGDRVALMLPNGPDWVCFDQAALGLGLVVVPIFVNDRPDNVAYILGETGARLLCIGNAEQWASLSEAMMSFPDLRVVSQTPFDDKDLRIISLRDWLPARDARELQVNEDDPGTLATIVYTSGTVGRPKGVMLSHASILWNAWASHDRNNVYPDDIFLSFLPLSHTLERTVGYYLPMMAGAAVAYARSIPQLAEDMVMIRPTVLISVPRIYERIYSRIRAQMAERPAFAQALFRQAVEVGWSRFEHGQGRGGSGPSFMLWPLLKRLVADKVLDRLGGRLRIAVCGGAPLPGDVARVFIGLGLPLVQGYGMTELSPVVSGNSLDDNEPGSVGRPLRDVSTAVGKQGELLVKSPGLMMGYLNNPEATAQAIDNEGWLHTGDKAELRDGRLYITGRLKDIIILSNGEKLPPEDIEMAIMRDPLIEQAMVIGEGRPFLVALLVINKEEWPVQARSFGLDPGDPAALRSSRLNDAICKRIGGLLREFPGYVQVRRVALMLDPWTVEDGLLTPTLKLRRAQVMEKMNDAIRRLYEGH